MRKVVTIMLSLILILSLSACSGNKAEEKPKESVSAEENVIKEEVESDIPEEINNFSSTESPLYPFAENLEEVTMGELYKGSVYKYVTVKVPENYALYGQGVSANNEKFDLDNEAWGGKSLKEIKENEEMYAEYQTATLHDIHYMGYNETEEELKHLFFNWVIVETKNRSGEEWDTTFEEDKAEAPGGLTIGSGTEHEAYFYDANIKPLEQSSSFTDDYYVTMMYKLNDEVYLGAVFYSDNLKKYSLEELSEAIYNLVNPIDSESAEYTSQEEEIQATEKEDTIITEYEAYCDNTVTDEDLYIDFSGYKIYLPDAKVKDFVENGWEFDAVLFPPGFILKKENDIIYLSVTELEKPSDDCTNEELFEANLEAKIVKIDYDMPHTPVKFLELESVDKSYGDPTLRSDAAKALMKYCLKGFGHPYNYSFEQMDDEMIQTQMYTKFIVDDIYYYVEFWPEHICISMKEVTSEINQNGYEWGEWFETAYYKEYKDLVKTW